MNSTTDIRTSQVNWALVWGLIALNASIIISWVAYHNYQPKLLDRFGFLDLSGLLGQSKLLVMATVPPLAGFLADRTKSKYKNSLPFVSIGVSITALIFMTVAATITPSSLLPLEGILPIMIILWLISMNLFYAPALATLEEFVPASQFTLVMGVFILVSDLIYAIEPAIILLVDTVGASPTFILGGVLIGGSGIVFNRLYKKHTIQAKEREKTERSKGGYLSILFIGLSIGFVVAYIINILPDVLTRKLSLTAGLLPMELVISIILGATALAAFFLSKRQFTMSRIRLFLFSFLFALLALLLTYFLPGNFAVIGVLGLIPCLATMSIFGFPLAISRVDWSDKMLAAGIFVAGLEVPDSLMELLY